MLLGTALVVMGSAMLYFGLTGKDPRFLLTGGGPAPVRFDITQFIGVGGGILQGLNPPPATGTPRGGTAAIRNIVLAARVVPGWTLGRICGSDTIPGPSTSEHLHCNAADLDVPGDDYRGSPAGIVVGTSLATWLINAGRTGILPIHCVIWWGQIWTRESKFKKAPYSGPNPHKGHVHVSAWPSVGGSC